MSIGTLTPFICHEPQTVRSSTLIATPLRPSLRTVAPRTFGSAATRDCAACRSSPKTLWPSSPAAARTWSGATCDVPLIVTCCTVSQGEWYAHHADQSASISTAAANATRACSRVIRSIGCGASGRRTPRGAPSRVLITRCVRSGFAARYGHLRGVRVSDMHALPLAKPLQRQVDDAADQLAIRDAGRRPEPREHAHGPESG